MDSTKKFENPSPEVSANFCNRLFFCWVLPFFKFGYKRDLEVKDIYNSTEEDLSGPLGDALEENWQKACKKSKDGRPKLQPVIFKTFWKSYFMYGFFLFLQSVIIKMLLPIVLAWYIKFYEKSCKTRVLWWGWSLGTGVVWLSFMNIVIMHYCQMGISRVGMRVRIAACSVIYRKLLRLNQASMGQTAAGKLVNLLSNDVIRFDMASWFLHYFWITPIQCAVALWIMYHYIGIAALPAMAAICLQAVLLQGYLSKLQGRFRLKIAHLTDNRVKIMSEITSGIQVIKMYAWEKPFDKVVELARRAEIKVVTQTSYIKGFSLALMVFTDRATLFIAVLTYVLLGKQITGEVVFSVAQLISTVQLYVSIFLPLAFSSYEEMKVSMSRIEEFLYLEENKEVIQNKEYINSDGSIKMVKVNASWLPNPIVGTLVDIDLNLKPGTLCCIIGPVGSGKSSLLQVLLKELPLTRGLLEVNGKVSYAGQEPWLFVSNVRQNILFGAPFMKPRYKEVVRACAMERDFQQLSHGDKTLVGEKGTSLSGGQRARVALARAVYREADIYLLDDPLSAVDAHVANHLFKGCIQGFLRGKTRILVTHQVQFLKGADLIIIMNNGRIERMGTYNDLSEKLLSNLSKEIEQQQMQEPEPKKELAAEVEIKKDTNFLQSISSVASSIFGEEPEESDELIEKGALAGHTYKEYFKAGASAFMMLSLLFLVLIAQTACNATDLWVTYWTNSVETGNTEGTLSCQDRNQSFSNNSVLTEEIVMTTPSILNMSSTVLDVMTTTPSLNASYDNVAEQLVQLTTTMPTSMKNMSNIDVNSTNATNDEGLTRDTYIYVYFSLVMASIILTTARSTLFMKICMNASTGLHNKMFTNVLKAPMRFFDTNPSGRILNRFSKDMGTVDEMLPKCMLETLQIFFVMIGILGLVFIVSPWMIAPAIVLGGLFWYGRSVYLSSAQDIKRLEGTTRAPVFSHVSASLYGLSTIRAFKAEDMVIKEFDDLQDTHTGTWVLFAMISESLGFYLDVISTAFLALVTFQFLVLGDEDTLSGDVGLVISQSLILTGMLQYGVRQSAEVASNMTSVERVLQYTNLDEEGPWEPMPVDRPPIGWPSQGCLIFRHAFLRYASEAPPALRNLNIEIKAGEKVGVVGRTGAGKSSLVASLFRLAPVDGKIELDGQDTGKVGLKNLRSSISIIPQTPTLFSATMRYNLDPFGYSTDDVLWQALDRVELRSAVSTLDMPVSEGGSNFSAGQRQLICLARAIVRNNKVLVMDEATANVDPATDGLIQKTIREAFKDCTVITVAHRLNTIMDADKVLVMEFGQGVEYASPHELLQNSNSYFAKMVKETGPNMESKLRTVAEQSFKKKQEKMKEVEETKIVDKSDITEKTGPNSIEPNSISEPNVTNRQETEPDVLVNGHPEETSPNHVNT